MKAVVVYESVYGNTHTVATAIASGLSTELAVDVYPVGEVPADILQDVGLLVVGGPTHAHGMTRPSTRKAGIDAARDPEKGLEVDPAAGQGVREWLTGADTLSGWSAAFDTRAHGPAMLTGRASRGIAKLLQHGGCTLLTEPESFLVSKDNHLLPGEEERAEAWGRQLALHLLGGTLASTS
jgi:hypothetical protein